MKEQLRKEVQKDLNRELYQAQLEEATEIIKLVASFERTDQLKGHDIMAACKRFLNPRIFHEDTFTAD